MSQELSILALSAATIAFIHTLLAPTTICPSLPWPGPGLVSGTDRGDYRPLRGRPHPELHPAGRGGHCAGPGDIVFRAAGCNPGKPGCVGLHEFRTGLPGLGPAAGAENRASRTRASHPDGHVHTHGHTHAGEHVHVHEDGARRITPWVVFRHLRPRPLRADDPGHHVPCRQGNYFNVIIVTAIFGAVTTLSMLAVVLGASLGLRSIPLKPWDRYSHALAGATLFLCGAAMQFLGL